MCLPCLFRLIALRTTKHTRVGLRERSTNVASAEFINFRWMQAVFFFSISFFFFFATTRSHNKPYPDEWHVPALGRPNKVVPALPQKRRSWFTELPNTSSCCWLERKVNRQGIFFRTPYPLVQSHFRFKPLCVTGVPNLLKYIIMTLRYVTLCCDIVIRDYMWCKTVEERHGSWSISIKYNHFLQDNRHNLKLLRCVGGVLLDS